MASPVGGCSLSVHTVIPVTLRAGQLYMINGIRNETYCAWLRRQRILDNSLLLLFHGASGLKKNGIHHLLRT
jgi:hypothetical protein